VYPLADDFAGRHLCLPLWQAIPTHGVARTLNVLTTDHRPPTTFHDGPTARPAPASL